MKTDPTTKYVLKTKYFFLFMSIAVMTFFYSGQVYAQCGPSNPPGSFNCSAFTSSYSPSSCVSEDYVNSIKTTESGGRYVDCVNSIGANGAYQFMDATRADVCSRTSLPCVSAGDFSHCPALQDAYFQEFNRLNYQQLQSCGALDRVGQTVGGVVVTETGLLAAAHLGGAGGACNWANSGAAYNPDDGATSLSDYAQTHGGLAGMGSDCPPVTPPSTPPATASCSGSGSPMCTSTDVGTDPDLGAPPLPIETPDIADFEQCADKCDNHPNSTTRAAYYRNCTSPPGSSYAQYSGCCCPGDIILGGGINSGRQCSCCGGPLC